MKLRIQCILCRFKQVRITACLMLGLLAFHITGSQILAQPPTETIAPSPANLPGGDDIPTRVEAEGGLLINGPAALQGYTLIGPMMSTETYLIDMQGRVVHTWKSDCTPALSAYLLENGHLLRPGSIGGPGMAFGGGPGSGGKVQEFTWDGELVWDFTLTNEKQIPHHDIARLPNGNVLMIVSDKKTAEEAIAAGRRPETVQDSYLLADSIIEVKPTGKTTGEIVWEWHLWDHIVQDHDRSKANYGRVTSHPELVDINFGQDMVAPIAADPDGARRLRSIGYVGATTSRRGPGRGSPDWTHFNSVAYNPRLDQIVVSVHTFSEIWIIDHGTTTAEAAGHSGGRSGKGGDLLYRWGNPRAYRSGTNVDQRLFAQHDAYWIPAGYPGEGHLLVFNNGSRRPDGSYSSVDEIVLPVDSQGHYSREPGMAFGPERPLWSYSAPDKSDFFSMLISGAQRLSNGNTLICSGFNGTVFEVNAENEIVWKYVTPVGGNAPPGGPGFRPFGGPGGPGGPPRLGQFLPSFLQEMLQMSEEQKKELDEVQNDLVAKIDKLLTPEQKDRLADPAALFAGGPGGFGRGGPPRLGDLIPSFLLDALELTAEQLQQLKELQKVADSQLDRLLTDDQTQRLKKMRDGFARGPFGFGPPGGGRRDGPDRFGGRPGGPGGRAQRPGNPSRAGPPGGPGGFPGFGPGPGPAAGPPRGRGGPPGGPGGPPGFGPPRGGGLFRSYRYTVDYPGLVGQELTPGKTLEELQRDNDQRPEEEATQSQ